MLKISPKYLVSEDNRPIAVQIDIKTFNRMTEALEDYGLAKYIEDVSGESDLDIEQAKCVYDKIKKEASSACGK